MIGVQDLILPKRGIVVPKPPSYIYLDMAFALGEGAKLGDKSHYRSHGTISGASWADGAHGRCLDFVSTVPDFVEIPAASSTQLNFTSEDFSIIIRARIDLPSEVRRFIIRGAVNVDGYICDCWKGELRFITAQADAYQLSSIAAYSLVSGTRYTLGVSRSAASVKLYVDGVDATDTAAVHENPATSARHMMIGIDNDGSSYPFDGQLEFLRVFGGIALSASEHLAYHNALA